MQFLLISFSICCFGLLLLLKTKLVNIALDKPNERSLHIKETPRTGGLAIMFAVLITWLMLSVNWYLVLLPFCLMLVSLMDDIYHLSVKWRLLAQLLISVIFVLMMTSAISWWLIISITLLITWMTNLYNFMDGSDGLAGGMGLFGFWAYAVAAFLVGDLNFALMNGVIAATCLAFLFFNFYPSKIFMGDSGSIPLGFLAGAMGVYGYFQALWPIWFPILIFSPFIVDATVTLIKRQATGEKIWQAHRSHYYQRLIQMGFGHTKTALAEYTLMFTLSCTSILMLDTNSVWKMSFMIIWCIVYFILMYLIDEKWNKQVC
ncbi:MAG: glycosyltransferase family 4 protein [Pedobacter sp.]|nr:glycosyltransferase family 4 protein [Pedobacter sp.]